MRVWTFFDRRNRYLGIHLGEDARVAHQGAPPLGGGLVEVGENEVAAEEVDGVVGGGPAEELGEHQLHHQQRQEGRQDAPRHAQHRALVFLFEVPLDQLLKEEAVAAKLVIHNLYVLSYLGFFGRVYMSPLYMQRSIYSSQMAPLPSVEPSSTSGYVQTRSAVWTESQPPPVLTPIEPSEPSGQHKGPPLRVGGQSQHRAANWA